MGFLEMPFLEVHEVRYLDSITLKVLEGLDRLAQTDGDGLQRVLFYAQLGKWMPGMDDNELQNGLVALLDLEQKEPSGAAAIHRLSWVQRLVAILDGSSRLVYTGISPDTYMRSIVYMAEMALYRSNRAFWTLLDKPWVQDGYTYIDSSVIRDLAYIAQMSESLPTRLLEMPFLESLHHGDAKRKVMEILVHLFVRDRKGTENLLSSPELSGGITDEKLATVALLEFEIWNPEAATAVRALPWIQDGIDQSEQDAVFSLRWVAKESDSVFRSLLSKPWMLDGITPEETELIKTFWSLARNSHTPADEALILRIMNMPFLEEIDSLDHLAMKSLRAFTFDDIERILSSPWVRDGITDDETDVISLLYWSIDLDERPIGQPAILDPERTLRIERLITLPLAGEVELTVIWPGESATEAHVSRTMDRVEFAVRTHEEFMGVPYPEKHAIALVYDDDPNIGRALEGSRIAIGSHRFDEDRLIYHEAAHTYWTWTDLAPIWIREGGATFLELITVKASSGAPLPRPENSCSLANSLNELENLNRGQVDVYSSACDYTLGVGLYLELYHSLGEEAFRQGFLSLYLLLQDEELRYECQGTGISMCYLRRAFVEGASSLESAANAEAIIYRRYYGASP